MSLNALSMHPLQDDMKQETPGRQAMARDMSS